MAGDDLQLRHRLAHQFCAALADETMRGAVEAIAANLIFFKILVRNRVNISLRRHGGMEGCIEYRNLRNLLAKNLLAGTDALQVYAVVQRSQRDQFLDGIDNLLVDQNGVHELHAALHHTVAHRGDLGQIFDHADLGVYQSVLDLHECRNVIGHVHRQLLLAAVGGLMTENTISKANSLAVSFCEYFLIGHINQLIFQG